MRRPHAGLFADIAWSTDTVAAQTRDRAVALGLDLVELPLWYDIDDAASLDRLVRETSESNTAMDATRHRSDWLASAHAFVLRRMTEGPTRSGSAWH